MQLRNCERVFAHHWKEYIDDKYVHIIMFKSLDIKKMQMKSIACYHYTSTQWLTF